MPLPLWTSRPGKGANGFHLASSRPLRSKIVPRGGDHYVYRIVDGKAVSTRVQLGLRRPGEVEIVDGLAAGQSIVTDGQLKLQDGTAVSVMTEKPAAAKP